VKKMLNQLWNICSIKVSKQKLGLGSQLPRNFIHENYTSQCQAKSHVEPHFHNFTGLIMTIIFLFFYYLIKEEPLAEIISFIKNIFCHRAIPLVESLRFSEIEGDLDVF
jgi:hypothetical protein